MKVWVIGRNYPESSNQMSGSFELEQARMLAKRGIEVSYLTTMFHLTKKIKGRGYKSWQDGDLTIFSYSTMFPPRIYPLYFCSLRAAIWRKFLNKVEMETGLPDVIHLHYPIMLLLADTLKEYQKKGVKIVVTEHWTKVLKKQLDPCELAQQKKYAEFVDQSICVGKPLKNAVLELTKSNREILVVPNIVNSVFCPSEKLHKGFVFVAVGRLVPIKQFDKIICAFSEQFKENSQAKLIIVGGGEEENKLKTLVKEKKIEKQIKLTGSLNRKDTANIVANADCLVCFSKFETFGVPIIEAWACGIPVIASTACAVMEKFDNKLGREVAYEDELALKEAMSYMFKNKDEFDKKYILNYATTHFSEEVISNRLIDIYQMN